MDHIRVGSLGKCLKSEFRMSKAQDEEQCPLCKKGRFIGRSQQLAFHQWTDKGYVFCRVAVTIGVCDNCGSRNWNKEIEALVDEAVQREYKKLP
jgi:C4-type Zn-finger protein